ncbi:MFS transporter [Phenylobacterium sp. Root77]|jgi:MFS family permease|uniref:MFS transporter n=1 Tax=unclassified Phenylobacterium TaxID=2640670 RepID=UPI0006FD6985|nr:MULTISPECIES: MFS transporter [unclassified Phenylobacterium]KQW71156.1 MFS transporter [Phenylobacterium sp. Root1277]KQW91274.1 MFS transporter [Phenylobacterium sp. Root1290]KRC39721.1 MFS transporter [Phenylobacterium sp. Root77]
MPKSAEEQEGLPKKTFAIIFGVSLVTAMGNTGMISVLPAIGRSIGIPDPMVAAIFSLSALLWAFSSPWWARASDRHGRKPLMLIGLSGFMFSMIACALVVMAGLHKLAAPMVIFVLFLFARALFGLFGAASNPATQAYVAEHTPPEKRTQSMSSLAGAFGLGTVIGPFIAPLFVLPFVGLSGPMLGFAVLAGAMLFVVWKFLPESKHMPVAPVKAEIAKDATGGDATKEKPMWRDPRVTPFLIYGFIVAVCQTAQGQTLGFLIIDKLQLSPLQAQGFIAIAMMFGAMAGLLAQWGIIRMFEMTPRQLLRWGVAVAALGNVIVAFQPTYGAVVAGYAISSLGFGLARPGFTAGSSLAVGMHEQARVAGAIAAVNGVNVVLAPFFVWLYERIAPAPFVLCGVLMVLMLIYAFRNPQLRNAHPQPATRADAAMATLEKSDEGGV